MSQYGFLFDQSRCFGCQACAVACKNWHRLPPGPLKYLKIYEYEKGAFPDIRIHYQWVPCYHCQEPACVSACPSGAMYKEGKYGAVLLDGEKCDGCRLCYDACPYGAPVFESDEPGVKARKCDLCVDRLESGENPICVLACPSRALDFGELAALKAQYGERSDLEDMPGSRITRPAVIFKDHARKQQLIPYDGKRAIELFMRKDPLPPLFTSPADLTEIPRGIIGRDGLRIKHKSVADLMRHTRNDEG